MEETIVGLCEKLISIHTESQKPDKQSLGLSRTLKLNLELTKMAAPPALDFKVELRSERTILKPGKATSESGISGMQQPCFID